MDAPATLPFPSTDRAEVIHTDEWMTTLAGVPVLVRVIHRKATDGDARLPIPGVDLAYRVEIIDRSSCACPHAGA